MADWQELAQTVIIALIFSYLVAKLISTVVHFREDNLRLARDDGDAGVLPPDEKPAGDVPGPSEGRLSEEDAISERGEAEKEEEVVNSDEDWEGVESSELDEAFSAATAFVAATAADKGSNVPGDVQLQLYALYKIATEGPCTSPQPSALRLTARAKWNAWQKLGAMPPEEAMEKYVTIVSELFPSWAGDSSVAKNQDEAAGSYSGNGPMGPVFSSIKEESDEDLVLESIHVSAREGKAEDLAKCLENGVSVNTRDSDGRTPLHWAVDRGHLQIVETLISSNADVNTKDNEGQTPLHYAALCEREAIAEFLVKSGAACDVEDNDGSSPSDICSSRWSFMASSS